MISHKGNGLLQISMHAEIRRSRGRPQGGPLSHHQRHYPLEGEDEIDEKEKIP